MNDEVREIPKSPGYDAYVQPYVDRFEMPPHEAKKSERLRALLGDVKFKRCLDIGCGIGFMTRYFVSCCEEIYGVDREQGKIDYIKRVIPTGHFAVVDLDKFFTSDTIREVFGLESNPKFDLIIFTDVMYYLVKETRKSVVTAICQMLEWRGLLLVSDHYAKLMGRCERRAVLEEAQLFLLYEELFEIQNKTWWVFEIFSDPSMLSPFHSNNLPVVFREEWEHK